MPDIPDDLPADIRQALRSAIELINLVFQSHQIGDAGAPLSSALLGTAWMEAAKALPGKLKEANIVIRPVLPSLAKASCGTVSWADLSDATGHALILQIAEWTIRRFAAAALPRAISRLKSKKIALSRVKTFPEDVLNGRRRLDLRCPANVNWEDHHAHVANYVQPRLTATKHSNLVAKLTREAIDAAKSQDPRAVAKQTSSMTRKPRGRKKADYKTIQNEAKLAADWTRARESNVYKSDFAKSEGMTTRELDRLLDRVAARKRRSDK